MRRRPCSLPDKSVIFRKIVWSFGVLMLKNVAMKGIKILLFLLIIAVFSSCRASCGCPMAEKDQKNTISPQEQTDGDSLAKTSTT